MSAQVTATVTLNGVTANLTLAQPVATPPNDAGTLAALAAQAAVVSPPPEVDPESLTITLPAFGGTVAGSSTVVQVGSVPVADVAAELQAYANATFGQ